MALVLKDRVKQAAAAPGTGTITLGATAAGFQSFASVGNGNTTYFAIVDPISGAWEVNYGVYTSSGTTLTRNATPLSSSTGTLVNFTGAVDVFVTYPSENAVWRDTAGVVVQQSFGAITATSAALTSGTITGAPVNATDIVNKEYADSIASGLNYHQPVNYASTAALPAYTYNNGASGVGATITANANGALSLGGGSPTATQRVLVKDEVSGNAPYNGIYVVTQAGSAGTPFILTRATDYDTSGTGTNEIDAGDYVLVISGTLASTAWVQQTPLPITVGTTALTFLQFNAPITYTAGTGLNLSPATTFNISNTGVTATTYGSASAVPVVTFNAQGQATGVTNTTIAIAGSQVSGNISGQAGSVANALTLGTYLTGGTYNGSAAVTATVDATSANTASKVVARDASGNFSAGTITATLSGSSTSATTATNLAGGAANQIPYQTGSGATSFITAASGTNTVLNFNGSAFSWSAGTISGVPLGSNLNSLTAGTYLTGTAYNGSAAQTWTVDATSANTASKVVARDASGNFSAGTVTAALSGNATTATTAATATTLNGYTQDIAANANTIVLRDSGGDIYQRYSFAVHFNQSSSNSENPTIGGFWTNSTADNYNRKSSPAHVISQLGLLTTSNYNSYAPTLTGTGASGTWGINITGNAATATTAANYLPLAGGTMTGTIITSTPSYYSALSSLGYVGPIRSGDTNVGASGSVYIPFIAQTSLSNSGYRQHTVFGSYRGQTWGSAFIAVGGNDNYPTVAYDFNYVGDFTAPGSARAPIFYDSDNTGYYVNPASYSYMYEVAGVSYVYGGYLRSGTNVYTDQNYGYGLIGAYSSTRFQGVFAMGDAYKLPPDGTTTGNLYGIAWSYPSAGGAAANLASHGMLILQNGTFQGAWGGGSLRTPGDVRGTVFYDWDNTGYYIDPASTGDTALRMRGGALFGANTTWGQYLYVGTNGNIDINTATVAVTNGNLHIDARNGYVMYLNNYATSSYTVAAQSIRSPIFYDYDNTTYYIDPAASTALSIYGGITFGVANPYLTASSYIVFPGGAYFNSGTVYVAANLQARGGVGNDSGAALVLTGGTGGYTNINGSARSPIYYDLDNTGYYLDPASSSQLATLYMDGWLYKSGSAGIYFTSYNYGIQAAGIVGAYGNIATYGTGQGGWNGYNLGGQWTLMNSGNGDNIGVHSNSTSWLWYWDGSVTNFYRGFTQFAGSARSPLFYDSDNTGYYGDFASTSRMNSILADVLYSYGNVTAYYSSDIKFKTNVRDIPNALEIAESIGGKLFDWTDEYIEEHGGEDGYFIQKSDFGVIAQDVLKVFPVAVRTRPDGSLAVDYEKLSALAFAAVASLSTRVKSLEARI